MKHVKNFIVEKRNFKDYAKYNGIINKKINELLEIESQNRRGHPTIEEKRTNISKQNDMLVVQIRTFHGISSYLMESIKELFGTDDYRIYPSNGSQLLIDIVDIRHSLLKEFDLELDAEKYNL